MSVSKQVLDVMIRQNYVHKAMIVKASSAIQLYVFQRDKDLFLHSLQQSWFYRCIHTKVLDYAVLREYIWSGTRIDNVPLLFFVNKSRHFKLLIESGFDMYVTNIYQQRVIHVYKSIRLIKKYLLYRVPFTDLAEERDMYGKTPLFYVTSIEAAEALLQFGYTIDAKCDNNLTLLHYFSHFPLDVLIYLVEKGAPLPKEIETNEASYVPAWPLKHVQYLHEKGVQFIVTYTNRNFCEATVPVITFLCQHQKDFCISLMKCNIVSHLEVYLRHGASISFLNLDMLHQCTLLHYKVLYDAGFHLRNTRIYIQLYKLREWLSKPLSRKLVIGLHMFGLDFMLKDEHNDILIHKSWPLQNESVKEYLLENQLVTFEK